MSCKGLLLLPDAPEDPEEEAETAGDTEATTCDTKLWTAGGRDACGGLCCTGNIGKPTIRLFGSSFLWWWTYGNCTREYRTFSDRLTYRNLNSGIPRVGQNEVRLCPPHPRSPHHHPLPPLMQKEVEQR